MRERRGHSPRPLEHLLAHQTHCPRVHRPPHHLRPNKGGEMPTHLHFVDCETVPEYVSRGVQRQSMWYGVHCYVRRAAKDRKEKQEWSTFMAPGELWDLVVSHIAGKNRHYVLAHNLKADARALHMVRELRKRGWVLKHRWEGSNARIFRWSKGKCTIMVLDNMNWFPVSIEAIGKWVGVEKIEIDWEHPDKEAVKRRCHNDVLTMVKAWDWWLKTIQEYDWGNFGITATSQAWHMYLHRYYKDNVKIHASYRLCHLERAAMRGARADVQRLGRWSGQTFYDLDGNAHYASQQVKYPYPVRLLEHHNSVPVEHLVDALKKYAIVAKVLFTTPVPAIPHKVFGFMCYPTGTFVETLTTRELQFVLERGEILAVYRFARYKQAMMFKEAIEEIRSKEVAAKSAGNRILFLLYKKMRQGLYGKWAQRGTRMKRLKKRPPWALDGTRTYDQAKDEEKVYEEFGGEWWEISKELVSFNSFPAVGAHITADARLALYEWIEAAGWENVYVVDTDGLMVNQIGFDRLKHLLHPSKLGYLKIEKVADCASVVAPKHWSCGDAVRWKGKPKNAVETAPGKFTFWSTPSLLEQERIGKDGGWLQVEVTRSFYPQFHLGRVGLDGRITPWNIESVDGQEYITNWYDGRIPNDSTVPRLPLTARE